MESFWPNFFSFMRAVRIASQFTALKRWSLVAVGDGSYRVALMEAVTMKYIQHQNQKKTQKLHSNLQVLQIPDHYRQRCYFKKLGVISIIGYVRCASAAIYRGYTLFYFLCKVFDTTLHKTDKVSKQDNYPRSGNQALATISRKCQEPLG